MTEVAVVGFAQSPCGVREDATTSGVEMLVPIFAEVFGATGLTKADIGFWCSGSCDYLAGRAFSFVSAVDAIGAVPPAMESHVEMDGAWALYEAWVKILTGEAEIALAYGFGKSSGAELRRVLALQLDPYLVAPLWPDSVSVAALQARLGLEAGRWTEKDMAEVAARSRAAAAANPRAQVSGQVAADELLGRPFVAEPLRAHDCAPVGDGAAVVIIASAERARDLCARPAWITGFAHRIDSGSLGARDLLAVPSATAAARAAGCGPGCRVVAAGVEVAPVEVAPVEVAPVEVAPVEVAPVEVAPVHGAPVEVAELHAPFTPPGDPAAGGARARRRRGGQPLGRRAVRQPDVRRRAGADRHGGAGGHVRPGRTRARARHQRPRTAAEPGLCRGGTVSGETQ